MAYDEALAQRVRERLDDVEVGVEVTAKRMFGGLAFLTHGHLTVGVYGDDLLVRMDPGEAEKALDQIGVRRFDLTRRPMRGWVVVAGELLDDPALNGWLGTARSHVATLPPK